MVVVSILLSAQLAPSVALACEGGLTKITIAPQKLIWKAKELGTQRFTLTSSQSIEITELTTNDGTDFEVPELTGCKNTTIIEPGKPCEVEVKRKTETKTGEQLFKWKYKEGESPGTGPNGWLEGQ
jgi:hypothetical protein